MKSVDVQLTTRPTSTSRADLKRARASARSAIDLAKGMVVLYGLGAVIAAWAVVSMTRASQSGLSSTVEHPFVGLGLGIGFANLVLASFMFAVLQFMEWRMAAARSA